MLPRMDVDADRAAYKVWENRIRRMAERQGLRLEKSRRRDTRAVDYGTYRLANPATNTVVSYATPSLYGLALDDIEKAPLRKSRKQRMRRDALRAVVAGLGGLHAAAGGLAPVDGRWLTCSGWLQASGRQAAG